MKSKVLHNMPQRAFVVVFDSGEEVVAGLLRLASEQHIVVESDKHLCRKMRPDLGVALLELAR